MKQVPVLKPYMYLHLHELDNHLSINEFKTSNRDFKKEKYESKLLCSFVGSLVVIVIHCCIWFELKSRL